MQRGPLAGILETLQRRFLLTRAGGLAFFVTLAWCALFPFRLTDGDSCLYAAMGHEMAQGGIRDWAAPQWASGGEAACFDEGPPAAFWLTALLEKAGLPEGQAPLAANALWLILLLVSLGSLAGFRAPDGGPGAGFLAIGILLLHYPMFKYVVRAGLEIPFAACATASLAAARSRSRWGPLALGAALGGAILTRGVFAAGILPLLFGDFLVSRAPSERRWGRLLSGLGLAVLLAAGLELAHFLETGHSFWKAYLEKQVLASLEPGGTPHPARGLPILYYSGRFFLYAFPWWAVALGAWLRRKGEQMSPAAKADLLLGTGWVLVFLLGVSLAWRRGSRYLFPVWPATAWLAAGGLRHGWRRLSIPRRRILSSLALALLPILTVGRSLATPRDPWWQAAEILQQARKEGRLHPEREIPGPVYGPFAPHDDRPKQFLRHHLGVWAFRTPAGGAPRGSTLWVPPGEARGLPPDSVLLRTPVFFLVRKGP